VSLGPEMRKLGVIGGIGPESTIAYYRLIIARYREMVSDDAYPPIVINSIDVRRVLDLAATDRSGLAEYLLNELQVLAQAGAALGVIAANTPHIVFDAIVDRSPIPLVSIVEATSHAIVGRQLTRVGLFGTRFTMQGRFYAEVLAKVGVELVVPEEAEQTYIHEKYVTELVNGTCLSATREGLLRIVDTMKARDGVQAIVLAGTELPLVLTDDVRASVPLLDTARIHVDAAAERLWRSASTPITSAK
jgi:aspartate racemase